MNSKTAKLLNRIAESLYPINTQEYRSYIKFLKKEWKETPTKERWLLRQKYNLLLKDKLNEKRYTVN